MKRMHSVHNVLLALAGALLFPACLYAQEEARRSVVEVCSQMLHRYVLTVEAVPKMELTPKTDEAGKPSGNISHLNRRITCGKNIQYWEVVSPTPLSATQCLGLVNAGKAKRTISPRINKDYVLALTGGLFPPCLYAQEEGKRCVLEVDSQLLHRYVLTVEVIPKARPAPKTDETKKPSGNISLLNRRITSEKAIQYWEVVSSAPLSARQCLDLVNAGKAKRTINPRINKDYAKIYKDGEPKNMTMEGEIDDIWDRDPYDGETHYEDPDLYEFIAD